LPNIEIFNTYNLGRGALVVGEFGKHIAWQRTLEEWLIGFSAF
jgi:hypothetical protein